GARSRIEDAIENGLDEQRHHALRRARYGHQHHRSQQMQPVPASVAEQAQQFVHACTRRRDNASITSRTSMRIMSPGPRTSHGVRQGPQIAGSDEPNNTTVGTPNAAAMWAGPESLPMKSETVLMSCLISRNGAPPRLRKSPNRRSRPSMKTGSKPDSRKC